LLRDADAASLAPGARACVCWRADAPRLRIGDAAALPGVSDDTVRRLIDAGVLSAAEDGAGGRVVDGYGLAIHLRSQAAAAADPSGMLSSARNRWVGLVTAIRSDPVMSQVELQCGPFRVVSLMSTEAVRPGAGAGVGGSGGGEVDERDRRGPGTGRVQSRRPCVPGGDARAGEVRPRPRCWPPVPCWRDAAARGRGTRAAPTSTRARDVMRTPRSPFAASLFGPTMVIGAVTGPEALHAADGWVVSGQADQPLSHGEPAIAVLQPGAVSVHRHPPSGRPRNTVAGVVTGLEPVGHLIRVRVGDLKADITPAAASRTSPRPSASPSTWRSRPPRSPFTPRHRARPALGPAARPERTAQAVLLRGVRNNAASRLRRDLMELDDLVGQGSVRPITRWGDPVLHRTSRPVTTFDRGLRELVADMLATMAAADGVGLAAPQIGVDLAVFVYDCPDLDGHRHRGVMCNPVLTLPTGRGRHLEEAEEGCLSLPGAHAVLARPDTASCAAQDLDGNAIRMAGTGLLARCLQHETDHLQGTVFGDRLPKRARTTLLRDHQQVADRYPDGWPATR
jgi:peptide deformylase